MDPILGRYYGEPMDSNSAPPDPPISRCGPPRGFKHPERTRTPTQTHRCKQKRIDRRRAKKGYR